MENLIFKMLRKKKMKMMTGMNDYGDDVFICLKSYLFEKRS
jgi:hypothetical protein